MRNLLTAFGILAFGAFLAFIIGTSLPEPKKIAEPLPPPVKVEIIAADTSAKSIYVQSHGVIEARQEIALNNEVSGRVIDVSDKFVAGGYFEPWDDHIQKIFVGTRICYLEISVIDAARDLVLELVRAVPELYEVLCALVRELVAYVLDHGLGYLYLL